MDNQLSKPHQLTDVRIAGFGTNTFQELGAVGGNDLGELSVVLGPASTAKARGTADSLLVLPDSVVQGP